MNSCSRLQEVPPDCSPSSVYMFRPALHVQTCLPCRRGSSVSLVLDMSSLSNTEPIQSVSTPRDVTVQLLNKASHVLTQDILQNRSWSLEELQEEFAVRCSECILISCLASVAPLRSYNATSNTPMEVAFSCHLRRRGSPVQADHIG